MCDRFEAPYTPFGALDALCRRYISHQSERRVLVEDRDGIRVDLVEIDHLQRRGELRVIGSPDHPRRDDARAASTLAISNALRVPDSCDFFCWSISTMRRRSLSLTRSAANAKVSRCSAKTAIAARSVGLFQLSDGC